jgi:hypothetical protein
LPPSRVQRRPLDHYAFVTSNSDDFSALNGDKRQPHSDLADHFATDNSTYRLGDAGLEQALHDEFGVEMAQMIDETYFVEEPRGLSDILAAEKEMFDKVRYERSMRHDRELIADGKSDEAAEHRRVAREGRERVEKTYAVDDLGPFDPFDVPGGTTYRESPTRCPAPSVRACALDSGGGRRHHLLIMAAGEQAKRHVARVLHAH